jgi:acetyltransferase
MLVGIGPVAVRSLSLADWDAFRAFGDRVTRDDMRLRFAGPVKLDASRCRRLLDIDHVREEAFAAFDRDGAILGVGRLVHTSADEADFALLVRSDLKRRGVGRLLLERLIRHADATGLSALTGDVLYENRPMLSLARRLGFAFVSSGGLMVAIRLELGARLAPRVPTHVSAWATGAGA